MSDIVSELANYEPHELFEVLIGMLMEAGSLEVELQQEASSMLGEAADLAAGNGIKENERLLRLAELAIGGGTGAAPSAGTLRTLLSLHQIAKTAPEAPRSAAVVDAAAEEVPQAAPVAEAVHEEPPQGAGSVEATSEGAPSPAEVRKRGRRTAQPAKNSARQTKRRQS